MLGIVMFFTAIMSTLPSTNGTPLRDGDLDVILKALKGRIDNENTSDDSSSSSAGKDGHNFEEDARNMEIIKLIKRVNKLKKTGDIFSNQKYKTTPNSVNHNYHNHQRDISNYDLKKRVLEQLLQKRKKPLKKTIHKRITPNRLLSYVKDDDGFQQIGGLNEYSKIYLILDPIALQNSKDSIDLSSLVSRILSQSSSAVEKKRQERNKNRYKGFMIKDSKANRFRRESKEKYGRGGGGAGGGDVGGDDDENRPKRLKYDHGGSGRRRRTYSHTLH